MHSSTVVAPYTLNGLSKTFKYVEPEVTSVEAMMEPCRPLVRSEKPLTRPKTPTFLRMEVTLRRREERQARRAAALQMTTKVSAEMLAERKLIKARGEFEKEHQFAQQLVYRLTQVEKFSASHNGSPFLVDLAAIHDHTMSVSGEREAALKRLQKAYKRHVEDLHAKVIINACTEVDDMEERRKVHRRNLGAVKLDRALGDLLRDDIRRFKRQQASATSPKAVSLPSTTAPSGESPTAAIATTMPVDSPPVDLPSPELQDVTTATTSSPSTTTASPTVPAIQTLQARPPSPTLSDVLGQVTSTKTLPMLSSRTRLSSFREKTGRYQDLPVYMAERERDLHQHTKLEVKAKKERDQQLQAIQEASIFKVQCEEEEKRQQKEKWEAHLARLKAEKELKVKEMKEARSAQESEALKLIERQVLQKEKKEKKKQQIIAYWRSQALGHSSSPQAEESGSKKLSGPIRLYPEPPPKK